MLTPIVERTLQAARQPLPLLLESIFSLRLGASAPLYEMQLATLRHFISNQFHRLSTKQYPQHIHG
jgi:hypothetical protein